jgi:uncharacterized protein YkwD
MRYLVVLAVALAAASAPVSAASSHATSASERRGSLEQEVLRELNRVRASRSLPALRLAPGLRKAAVTHSRSMLEAGFFDHVSPDGTSFDRRIRTYYSDRGWRSWSVGETLLATSEPLDAQLMVAEWIRSSSHRAIILSSTWRDVGIGAHYAVVPPGTFGGVPTTVVTADFGVRSGRVSGTRG